MTMAELRFKEQRLRACFESKLEDLDVEGYNEMDTVKCVKTFGALWHYTHQLLLAREKDEEKESVSFRTSQTSADTMDIKATGLKMNTNKLHQ